MMTCSLTSDALGKAFEASSYGSNPALFAGYFVPGSMPPQCVACGRLIGQHPSAASVSVSGYAAPAPFVGYGGSAGYGGSTGYGGQWSAATSVNPQHPASPVVGSVSYADPLLAPTTGVGTPANLVVGPTEDVATAGAPRVMCFLGGIFAAVSGLLVIVFVSVGVRVFVVFIGPAIMLCVGLFLCLRGNQRTTVVFNKQRQTMDVHERSCFCTTTSTTFNLNDILSIQSEFTNVSVNRVRVCNVTTSLAGGRTVILETGNMFDIEHKVWTWKRYIASLRRPR